MNLVAEEIASSTSKFPIADVEKLTQRALLRRIDQKFVLPLSRLNSLLNALNNEYDIVYSPQQNVAEYHTQYFDTPERTFFIDHLRGRRPRYKVRIRHYPDRQLSMLECKKKTSANLTMKTRVEIPFNTTTLKQHTDFFSDLPYSTNSLRTSLLTQFSRITLIHRVREERLTIDFNLQFSLKDEKKFLKDCVIIESKRSPLSSRLPVDTVLKSINATPLSVSKYCIGGCYLFNSNKALLYRTKLRMLRKIIHDRTI